MQAVTNQLTWLWTVCIDIFYLLALWTGFILTLIVCSMGLCSLFMGGSTRKVPIDRIERNVKLQ